MADIKAFAVPTEIVVDDGSVRVPIKNLHGEEIGVFYFRPTDVGIIERYNDLLPRLDSIIEPLKDVSLDREGNPTDDSTEEQIIAINASKERLFEELNTLFGGDMASAFFGKQNPFSPVGGKYYLENAIEAVGNYIGLQFGVEAEKMSAKAKKYTEGYEKK